MSVYNTLASCLKYLDLTFKIAIDTLNIALIWVKMNITSQYLHTCKCQNDFSAEIKYPSLCGTLHASSAPGYP